MFLEYFAKILGMVRSIDETVAITERDRERAKMAIKGLLMTSTCLLCIAFYFCIGFFFDVFAEACPLLLIPILPCVYIGLTKKYRKKLSIFIIIILLLATFGASFGVGLVATSKPGYGEKIISGHVDTINYSKSFMKKNYDINQKTQIKVWVPDNYDSSKKYPVMFVLDGDNLFDYAAQTASFFSSKYYNADSIIVGIGYGYWNATFARGGLVRTKGSNLRGRWRDYVFEDDTELDYTGALIGGSDKRGKEFTDFVVNTVVKDVREKYSVDNQNSTIFGHSLGAGVAAYFLTQYRPTADTPFTNFVIVDNAYLDYYKAHLQEFRDACIANGNKTYSTVKTYRIWGGEVNPDANSEQHNTFTVLESFLVDGLENHFWIPRKIDHSESQIVGIDNAICLMLDFEFGETQTGV